MQTQNQVESEFEHQKNLLNNYAEAHFHYWQFIAGCCHDTKVPTPLLIEHDGNHRKLYKPFLT